MARSYRAASRKKKVIEEYLGLTGLAAAAASCDVPRTSGRRPDLDRLICAAIKLRTSPAVPPAPGHGSGRTRRIRPRSATTIVIGEHRRARIAVTGFSQGRWYPGHPLIAPHAGERLTDGRHLRRCRR